MSVSGGKSCFYRDYVRGEVRTVIRRKTTKEILGESIHELAAKKPVDKITVREIVENCGLSSASFYHHFHDK